MSGSSLSPMCISNLNLPFKGLFPNKGMFQSDFLSVPIHRVI